MGDHLGTRVVTGSNARYCPIPLGYGCPGCAVRGQGRLITRAATTVVFDPYLFLRLSPSSVNDPVGWRCQKLHPISVFDIVLVCESSCEALCGCTFSITPLTAGCMDRGWQKNLLVTVTK
jgi:hypothetical protein